MKWPRLITALLVIVYAALSFFASDRSWLYQFVLCSLLAALLVWWQWRLGEISLSKVLLWAFVFRSLMIWVPPGLSDDVFRYIWDGMLIINNVNPYHYLPADPYLADYADEPIFSLLNSGNFYSVYPPVSQSAFALGGLFYKYGWHYSYYAIKLLFVTAEAASLLLLSRMVDARRLVLYAWNPLVIVTAAGQAHTESLLVFFLVLYIWAYRKGKGEYASVALVCAGLVKLYPFFLFPALWQRYRWRALWPALLVLSAFVIPFFDIEAIRHLADSLDLYVRYFEFNAGFYYALKKTLYVFTGADHSKTLGPLLRGVFLTSVPIALFFDFKNKWSLRRVSVVIFGAFLLTATTIHPWYLLGVLVLAVPARTPSWHWYWLGICSLGTYLLYIDGPYWWFVWSGWFGWGVLVLVKYHMPLLQIVQKTRSRTKTNKVITFLPWIRGCSILDLGAGEGYVGAQLQQAHGAAVTLVDVIDINQTSLQLVRYDGARLPFADNAFDLTILYYVLHHCSNPAQVLSEAVRVSKRGIIVVESVYTNRLNHLVLTNLDKWANRLRSHGLMTQQEGHLHFRTALGWKRLFSNYRIRIAKEQKWGHLIHRRILFYLEKEA